MSMGMSALTLIVAMFCAAAIVVVFEIIVFKMKEKMLSTSKDDEMSIEKKEGKIVKNQKKRIMAVVIGGICLMITVFGLHINMGVLLFLIFLAILIAIEVFHSISEEEIKFNIKEGERIRDLRAKSTKDDKAPAPIARKG